MGTDLLGLYTISDGDENGLDGLDVVPVGFVVSDAKERPGVEGGGPGDFDDGVVVLDLGGFHPVMAGRRGEDG